MKAKHRRCPRCRRRVRVKKSGGLWLHFARPGISFGYCEGSGLLIALAKRQRAIDREMKRAGRSVVFGRHMVKPLTKEKRMSDLKAPTVAEMDAAVMTRLRAPFGCEYIEGALGPGRSDRWRIHDANDDAIASVSGREESYARLIVQALNEHFERKGPRRYSRA